VKKAVLDDHLLRDVLADDLNSTLTKLLTTHEPCTTNMYLLRLCRSVVSARGGQLTGSWTSEQRIALGRKLVAVTTNIEIVPMQNLATRMAELTHVHRLSALGTEAIAAAEHLQAALVVWAGDDGIGIRSAAKESRIPYRTIRH
jgi:hypothetical protein